MNVTATNNVYTHTTSVGESGSFGVTNLANIFQSTTFLTNPVPTAAGVNDFKVVSGFVGINAGINAASTYGIAANDYFLTARPIGPAWDIGAHEFGTLSGPGTISFNPAAHSAGESAGSVTLTAIRTGGVTGAVGASYATSNGSATSPSDYTATSGTLSWANNDGGNKTFSVTLTNDATTESSESFTATLSSPTGGATLGTATATITITDDDNIPLMPGLSFEAESGLVESPFTVAAGVVSQSTQTLVPGDGGRVRYRVTIPTTGDYRMAMSVNAPDLNNASIFVDFDQEPAIPTTIWDILPLTSGIETRNVAWRGAGDPSNPQFPNKTWTLSAGEHVLYIRGRESNCLLDSITIFQFTSGATVGGNRPGPPKGLRVIGP